MKKWCAFTLAEIMIAMSIVGAVAAMTIPTLAFKRTKHEYSVKLKSFYSRMNNAVIDMIAENGRDMAIPANGDEYNWYINVFDPFIGHKRVDKDNNSIYFADGSKIILGKNFTSDCIDITFDTNGDKVPNTFGRDQYIFAFCFGGRDVRLKYLGDELSFFGVFSHDLKTEGVSRDKLLEVCTNDPKTCGVLIEADGWEYKSDYPIKF